MILIADSGSTKTEWQLISPQSTEIILGQGINPYYQNASDIHQVLQNDLEKWMNSQPEKIYFYGAGCTHPEKNNLVQSGLQTIFPKAKIMIDSDLLGAGRSLSGNQAGVICILGTGTNANFYDGKTFPNYLSSLGFLLGDEGSGAYFGKCLIQDFLRQELPENLTDKFKKKYPVSRQELIQKVYRTNFPNQYLAKFVPFLKENLEFDYTQELFREGFQLFVQKTLSKVRNYQDYPVHFMGSIAFHFQEILREILKNEGITIGKIVKTPSEGLRKYHLENL